MTMNGTQTPPTQTQIITERLVIPRPIVVRGGGILRLLTVVFILLDGLILPFVQGVTSLAKELAWLATLATVIGLVGAAAGIVVGFLALFTRSWSLLVQESLASVGRPESWHSSVRSCRHRDARWSTQWASGGVSGGESGRGVAANSLCHTSCA